MNFPEIPAQLYLPIAAGLTIAYGILTILKRQNGVLGKIISSARDVFITPERVDAAARAILQRLGVPVNFAEWSAKIIADLIAKVPAFTTASADHLRLAVASAFGKLSAKEAKEMFPSVSDDILSTQFGRARLAETILSQVDTKALSRTKVAP